MGYILWSFWHRIWYSCKSLQKEHVGKMHICVGRVQRWHHNHVDVLPQDMQTVFCLGQVTGPELVKIIDSMVLAVDNIDLRNIAEDWQRSRSEGS